MRTDLDGSRVRGPGGAPRLERSGGGPLQVSLFGSLRVATPSAALDVRAFPGVKPKQLLEVLLCERGHRVSKSRLAELLWADAPPQDHVATLETYVSVVRRTLEPRAGARGSVLVTENGGYRIGPDGLEVDLDVFDRLRREAVGVGPAAALERLHSALDLVRGPVLEDEPDASWTQLLRDTYRDRTVQTLVDAGRLSLVTGDAPSAMDLAQQAVALNPLAESAYQVLMTAAYALWRQDEALAAFDRCRRLLGEELGTDPMDETVSLYLAILRHEQVADLMQTVSAGALPTLGVAAPPRADDPPRVDEQPVLDHLRLLGRERELAVLQEAVVRARAGRLTVALVTGAAGIGKTALVDQLAQGCALPLAANRCSDVEAAFPYLALSLALRSVRPDSDEHGLPALDRLVERATPLDQLARLGAMEAFATWVSDRPPFLLWLDDAQWADPETITTLSYLQRRCPAVPLLVVLTCDRSRSTLEALRTLRPDVRLDLGLLTQRCVDALGHDELFAVTAGHPLFVDGWLKARREGLPQQFSAALCERALMACWNAGPQGYQLLSVAAGLERPALSPSLLAALVGAEVSGIVDELDHLVELGLLTWVGQEVAFSTPALRSILSGALSPARRSFVQERAELLDSAAGDPAA